MSSTLSSHPTLTPNLNTSLQPNSTPTPSIALARSLSLNYTSLLSIPPLDLFYEQLRTYNAETRVDAMRRLFVVANAIGQEMTLNFLIPYLANHVAHVGGGEDLSVSSSSVGVNDEEDEILLILAEQLGQMVVSGLIPGVRASSVLPILEKLAGVEETVVRDRAVESINMVVPLLLPNYDSSTKGIQEEETTNILGEDDAPALVLATVKRLSNAEWFTTRISACGVLPSIYTYFTHLGRTSPTNTHNIHDIQRELRGYYGQLCDDDTPMVRRGAGTHLGRFFEAVAGLEVMNQVDDTMARALVRVGAGPITNTTNTTHLMVTVSDNRKELITKELVTLYCNLATDEQDSVRLLAVGNSGSVACALGRDVDLCKSIVIPIIKSSVIDLSWRVRHHLSKEFAVVAYSQGYSESSSSDNSNLNVIFQCFASLLQDVEGEVRASAVDNIARMAQLGGADQFQTYISPTLQLLADDPIMEVRSKLAESIMDCCDETICTALPDHIILQDIHPLLEGFLSDDYAEVQLHILGNLNRVSHLFHKMDAIVKAVLTMTTVLNWRVRKAVARLLPHLADARGVRFFEEQLMEPWMKLLLDQVADVRLACVTGMSKLLSVAGAAWIQREIVPHYVSIYKESSSYLVRITILRSYAALAIGENLNFTLSLLNEIVNQLLRGLEDIVANVRIVAIKGLESISGICEESIWNAQIRPALTVRVMEDEDEDCKHFAQVALDKVS